jgi:hypothetical protein
VTMNALRRRGPPAWFASQCAELRSDCLAPQAPLTIVKEITVAGAASSLRERNKVATRRLILDTAARLFSEHRFDFTLRFAAVVAVQSAIQSSSNDGAVLGMAVSRCTAFGPGLVAILAMLHFVLAATNVAEVVLFDVLHIAAAPVALLRHLVASVIVSVALAWLFGGFREAQATSLAPAPVHSAIGLLWRLAAVYPLRPVPGGIVPLLPENELMPGWDRLVHGVEISSVGAPPQWRERAPNLNPAVSRA